MKATKAPSKSAVTAKAVSGKLSAVKTTATPASTSAIVKASLPGQEQLADDLLDTVVADLNRLHRTKGMEMVRTVGEYVLKAFFDGDPDNFRRAEKKHISFRKLAKRKDLNLAFLFIWNAVSVVDQLRLLPEKVVQALPLSHHKLLLPVKDKEAKITLALQAVDEKLSKRDFEDRVHEVTDAQKEDTNVGRPRLPGFAKAITLLKKVIKVASEDITEKDVVAYGQDKAKQALGELEGHISALQEVAEELRRYAGE